MGLALKGLNISLIGKRHSTNKNEIAVEKWICCSTMESSSLRNRAVIAHSGKAITEYRTSHQRCSREKYALKNFANFTLKHLCWSLFLINFIKKRLPYRCFPVKLAKILKTPILKNICEGLCLRILEDELLNSTSRFLYFNECFWTNFLLWAVYSSMVHSSKSWAMHFHYI